jgi:hypothetical protein
MMTVFPNNEQRSTVTTSKSNTHTKGQPDPLPLLLQLHRLGQRNTPCNKSQQPNRSKQHGYSNNAGDKSAHAAWDSAVQETTTAHETVAPQLHQGNPTGVLYYQPLGSFFVLFGQAKRT